MSSAALRSLVVPAGWRSVRLGDVADHCLGKMLDAQKNKGELRPYLRNPNIQWLRVDLTDLSLMPFEERETERYGLRPGDVLVCEGGEAGRAAIWESDRTDVRFQKAIHRVRPGTDLLNRFLVRRLQFDYANGRLADYYTGATIKHLTGQDLARYEFALPPLAEQRRIAAILDQADVLRAKRRHALACVAALERSVFAEMFGDPVLYNGPRRMRLGDLALKFSDGPFGSHLKTEHYTDHGVRVVRLQNIGLGEFLDKDKAFVSLTHFKELQKHECLPGDVLVATLGEPNLRACLLPSHVERAINKADCVQIRPRTDVARAEWLIALLSHPSVEKMAQSEIVGQTRLRISMGRLRELVVAVPPISEQIEFGRRVARLSSARKVQAASAARLDHLFKSLQHRAFSGEL